MILIFDFVTLTDYLEYNYSRWPVPMVTLTVCLMPGQSLTDGGTVPRKS